MKNCQVTRALTYPWTESKCTVFRNFPTANTHRRKVFFFCHYRLWSWLFSHAILILSQDSHHDANPILFVFCTTFSPDAWHSELQEYQAAQTGPGEQIQHRFVAVFSLEDRVSLLLLYKLFNTTLNLLLTQKGVCVSVSVYFCLRLCVRQCLLRGYRQELSSLQLSQWDVNIYDMLFAIWCELFLLQTSASDTLFAHSHSIIKHREYKPQSQDN